jgi:coenzyme F420-0:L-glutamate ligase/coenzyme F420-1:gamma-L-glutamate ligase
MAAAGVDASNTGGVEGLLLLPPDPDAEAARLREGLVALTGLRRIGVVVSDTAGRAWRVGQVDFALGSAGVRVTDDLRGGVDADGQPLHVTTRAVADELAAAADLAKGKVDHIPVAVVSGTDWAVGSVGRVGRVGPGARSLVRTGREDWFGHGRAEAVRAALGVEPGSLVAERVGIAAVGPEEPQVRVERAVRVACAGLPFASGADTSRAGVVEVGADSAFRVGVVAARLRVALWGEGLDSSFDDDAVEHGAGDGRAVGRTTGDWHVRVTCTER